MTRFRRAVTMAAAACAVIGTVLAAGQRSAQVALRAAVETETVRGDVTGAIGQYQHIVDLYGRSDRATAVQALLRMAEAYQKLGDAQARSVYEQIVRDYADQTEAVALARTRLGAASAAARTKTDRVVKSGESITWGDGRVSPDGRFITYTDWQSTGNLMLHDLVAGADRPLTGNKDWSVGNAYTSTFSRDGKQVAYGWRGYTRPAMTNELRIVSLDGPGIPQPRRVYSNDEIDFFKPTDWSPDGKSLAVLATRKDRSSQIALVGVQDRSFRALKTVGWRGPNKIFFSPDGKYLAYDLPANDHEAQRDVFVISADGSRETPVVQHPADDVVMGWSPDGSRLLFASDRTNAVALWTLPLTDGKPQGAPTLLKPDIGSVLSQGLTSSGALHLVKDTSTLSLQIAPIDLEAGRLAGPSALENFRSARPDWSRDGKLLVYRTQEANGLPLLSIRSVESGRIDRVRPALAYINEPRWLSDARSLVAFGRDFKGRAGIYQIDTVTGQATLITDAKDINRVQVSPDGRKIYYTIGFHTVDAGPAMIVERNLSTGETREVCRWPSGVGSPELSPDGRYLAMVGVDSETKSTTLTLIPVVGGEPKAVFRVNQPDALVEYGGVSWTSDSQALIAMNTIEGKVKDLWLVPVDGNTARKLHIDTRGWHPDGIRLHGTQIAFFTGRESREVWALENVLPPSSLRRAQ